MKFGKRISIMIVSILVTCTLFASGVYAGTNSHKPTPIPLPLTGPSDSTVTFYGEKVSLPVKYSELSKLGWKIGDKSVKEEMIPSHAMSWVSVSHGKKSLEIVMYNFEAKPMKTSKCYVIEIMSMNAYWLPISEVMLSNGLTIGRSYDEVIAAYGEPDMLWESENEVSLSYYDSGNRITQIMVDLSYSVVLRFIVRDVTNPDIDSAPLPGPDPMTGPSDATMQIDGVTISFPMKYSDLEALGWTTNYLDYGDALCEPGCTYYMTGTKGDKTLGFIQYNFGTEPIPLTESYVIGMTNFDSSGLPSTHVVLSNGLSIGRTYDEVIAAYGDPMFTASGFYGITLTYQGPDQLVTYITFDFELSKVVYFEVWNMTSPQV